MAITQLEATVRGELTKSIAELEHAPPIAELASRSGCSVSECEAALAALGKADALLLHPGTTRPWVVHPFALSPGSCWVEIGEKGWWANCLYCAFGIVSAIGGDARISTRMGGERESVEVQIRDGELVAERLLFHLSTPPRLWWENVIHACASFQPFRAESDVDRWCHRHDLPKGAVVPLERMWLFAQDWYGDYIRKPWCKRSSPEVAEIFERHGFTSPFWSMA